MISPNTEEIEKPNVPSQRDSLVGYEVTTSVTLEGTTDGCALITEVEAYIRAYVTLLDPSYALVIALWLTATHAWAEFDAFPYLVVTSTTKRSGKTRLLELLFFVASNSRMVADISPAALYHTIDAEKPTLLIDEAEKFSSANSEYRPLLNAGYRRGQTVKRHDGDYETYCPKAFALIGDVHDTLRDRSVAIEMRRGEPARRFVYAAAKEEGAAVREKLTAAVSSKVQEIAEEVGGFGGLPFLTDRDEEIWTPLFILCRLFCPERLDELERTAADISAAKTAKAKRYTELGEQEDKAQEQEYAIRLLRDMVAVTGDRDQITTQEAIAKLREIPTSPWRRFRGDGLKDGIEGGMLVAGLLSQFGVKPTTIRIASKNVGTGSTAKGYKRDALLNALAGIDGVRPVEGGGMMRVCMFCGRQVRESEFDCEYCRGERKPWSSPAKKSAVYIEQEKRWGEYAVVGVAAEKIVTFHRLRRFAGAREMIPATTGRAPRYRKASGRSGGSKG